MEGPLLAGFSQAKGSRMIIQQFATGHEAPTAVGPTREIQENWASGHPTTWASLGMPMLLSTLIALTPYFFSNSCLIGPSEKILNQLS